MCHNEVEAVNGIIRNFSQERDEMKTKPWGLVFSISTVAVLLILLVVMIVNNQMYTNRTTQYEQQLQETLKLQEDYAALLLENKVLQDQVIVYEQTSNAAIGSSTTETSDGQTTNVTTGDSNTEATGDALTSEETAAKMATTLSLEAFQLKQLEKAGINQPQLLTQSLMANPEVIGVPAVLGGTMGFTKVAIINEKWVYGAFEDGHIMGYGIYEWAMNAEGTIIWKEISSIENQ